MPMNYSEYPAAWRSEIRPAVLARAGQVLDEKGKVIKHACCENCGVENHLYGYRDIEGKFIPWSDIENALDKHGYDYFSHELEHHIKKDGEAKNGTKIVLTIAHLDHDKRNKNIKLERLAAWCQRCHLNYDRHIHIKNRQRNLQKKKGIIPLFK